MRRPQKRPGESREDYEERMAAWETMTRIGTEMKRARSFVEDALRTVEMYERSPKVPESQRDRVAHWRGRLEIALAELTEDIDVDAWKTELYGDGK